MIEIVPTTVKAAQKLVTEWHRHLPKIQGGLFAAAVAVNDEVVAVGIACNPPPAWNGKRKIVIGRVAVKPGTDVSANSCSRLYGSLSGAAQRLGWKQVWTYTLPHEPGTSLVAAGFTQDGTTAGSEHGWESKTRIRAKSVCPEPKKRWFRNL